MSNGPNTTFSLLLSFKAYKYSARFGIKAARTVGFLYNRFCALFFLIGHAKLPCALTYSHKSYILVRVIK